MDGDGEGHAGAWREHEAAMDLARRLVRFISMVGETWARTIEALAARERG